MTREIGDIAAALAYQVKKEIAENFFGTRKRLEEEREELLREERELFEAWTHTVLPILQKIRSLLVGEEEGRVFSSWLGMELAEKQPGEEKKGTASEEGSALPPPPFAWTKKGKYRKYILRLYREALVETQELEERFRKLVKKVELFNEELNRFNHSFRLSEILSLTGSLEGIDEAGCVLGEACEPEAIPHLEEKLRLTPLLLNRSSLPHLPPFKDIGPPLKKLIDGSFRKYGEKIKADWPAFLSLAKREKAD